MVSIVKTTAKVAINPKRRFPRHGYPLYLSLMYAKMAPISTEANVVQLSCALVVSDAAFRI